jgi:hypothetical protein
MNQTESRFAIVITGIGLAKSATFRPSGIAVVCCRNSLLGSHRYQEAANAESIHQ